MKSTLITITFLSVFLSSVLSQVEELEPANIILNHEFDDPAFHPRKTKYLFADKKSVIVKYNPISLAFGGLLLFYQKVISQQLGSNCPYEISCSEFSRLCITEYGLIKGIALSADRLTRCTEFTKADITPLWFNDDFRIIDPISRYRLKEKHDHSHH